MILQRNLLGIRNTWVWTGFCHFLLAALGASQFHFFKIERWYLPHMDPAGLSKIQWTELSEQNSQSLPGKEKALLDEYKVNMASIVIPTPSEAGNNRNNSYPSVVLTCSQAQEGAWNCFLNEIWEFFVDFNYPSSCWTSLAHVIENWLYIIRTTGISSLEAVTLVLLIPCSLKTYRQPPSNRQPQKLARKSPNSSITTFPVKAAYMEAFVSYHSVVICG